MKKAFLKINNGAFFETVKESLKNGERVKFPVAGNSMRPALRNGDVVCVKPLNNRGLQVGSIVLSSWKGNYVLHRLVRKYGGQAVLAGDNNLVQLEMVSLTDIIAVVSACYRDEKLFSHQTNIDRIKGLAWYYTRIVRRIIMKINRVRNKRNSGYEIEI
ncbi:S24/S26 family peptidase [Sphingobacterium shayense]|uniref:S24/S26 family peptidase n=1 Tax=Sphingobacterium shayense TaxID=626343 RepID=UPI0015543297|nr:S24/S26 family peptidase [Sphingobacterium shayense]NQD70246.1 S24/S26 family peptidase [Sphingobacterium shayense]